MTDDEAQEITRETSTIEQRVRDVVSRHGSNVVLDDMQRLISYIFRLCEERKNPDEEETEDQNALY